VDSLIELVSSTQEERIFKEIGLLKMVGLLINLDKVCSLYLGLEFERLRELVDKKSDQFVVASNLKV
jgi:hypothetical protein